MTDVRLTQETLEHWASGTPQVQLTQIAIEQWAVVALGNPQVIATQLALEHWASVAQAAIVSADQARAVIMA